MRLASPNAIRKFYGFLGDTEAGTVARYPRSMTDLEAAWAADHDTAPEGWYVGRPGYEERHNQWSMCAFDQTEKPVVGKRWREWTAVVPTELSCVREMARGLAELGEGRWSE